MDSRIISNTKEKNCTQFLAHFLRNWKCCVDCFQRCPRGGLGQTMRALAGFKKLFCGIRAEIWKMAQGGIGTCCRVMKEILCFPRIMVPNAVECSAWCSRWWLCWDGGALVLGIIPGEHQGGEGEAGTMQGCVVCFQQPLWRHSWGTWVRPRGLLVIPGTRETRCAGFGNKQCP